jgi:hypothetical protein
MGLRKLIRTPTSIAVADLRVEVDRLAGAVRRLEERSRALDAAHRKEAEQAKTLREALAGVIERARRAEPRADPSVDALRRTIKSHAGHVRKAMEALAHLEASRAADARWRKVFDDQLSALVRHVCLPLDRLSPPYALTARRFRLRSQNEGDGVLFALLARAGWGRSRFVEIGSGQSGWSAAALALECGWAGLMLALEERSVEVARRRFAANRGVQVVAARVTPASVDTLLAERGYAGEVDLLSIDIDSYDYWVFQALEGTSPRVLVLVYNAHFGPERAVTIPLDQPLETAPMGYKGASLAALAGLAARKGFRLVACENAGVNAFFLRHDVAPEIPAVTPLEAYRPLLRGTELGEVERPSNLYEVIAERGLPLIDV